MSGIMLLQGGDTGGAPFAITADKAGVSASWYCSGSPPSVCPTPENLVTDAVTVTTSGGSGAGPTFAWTKISGSTFVITSAAAASTTFSIDAARGGSYVAVYRCTVTRGVDVLTVDVLVTAEYTYDSGL